MKAEERFGVSRPNLEGDLAKFYDKAKKLLIQADPSMERELKYMSKLPLHILPFKERVDLISQYREAIGFDEALTNLNAETFGSSRTFESMPNMPGAKDDTVRSIANIYNNLLTDVGPSGERPFGRLPHSTGDLLSNIYSRLNIQFRSNLMADRAGLVGDTGALPSHYFTVGLNSIPSEDSFSSIKFNKDLLKGKSTLTYDVETAGLTRGQIREVAYERMENGVKEARNLVFTPAEFNRGVVNVDGRAANLTDFINRKFGTGAPKVSNGSKFARDMVPFLKHIINTDYIVGHNISGFDNEQVFVGLSRTKEYANDDAFRSLVDEAFEKAKTSTIDTMDLVRQMPGLENIKTAKEISDTGSRTVYSISNLLLETDLSDKIGLDNLAELMGLGSDGKFKYGLHHGAVDTAVTGEILKAAQTDEGLQLKRMGDGLGGDQLNLANLLRDQIRRSAAITPVTNLSEVSQITDDVLRKAIEDYDNEGILRATKGTRLDSLLSGDAKDKSIAFRELRSETLIPDAIKMTPLEQGVIIDRNIAGGIADDAIDRGSILPRINKFRSKDSSLGLPLSGLSDDEKTIAHGISEITANIRGLDPKEANVAGLASDTLVSRFNMFEADKVQYRTRSGRASLPAGILRDAGLIQNNDMLSLSVFGDTASSKYGGVNLVKHLGEGDIDVFERFLLGDGSEAGILGDDEKLAKSLGVDVGTQADELERFRKAVNEENLLGRLREAESVSVGQIYDKENPGASKSIGDLFRRHFNVEGQLRDDNISSMRVAVMEADYDDGIIRTAGVFQQTGLNTSIRQDIGRAVDSTRKVYEQYKELPNDGLQFRMAKMARASGAGAEKVQAAYKAATEVIVPNMTKGIIGLGAAGIGALLFKRHQENETLDETLDFQGYEGIGNSRYGIADQIQEKIDMGYDGYSNQMDPLATASLTRILNDSRTGHMSTSWSRNNSIYGGLL